MSRLPSDPGESFKKSHLIFSKVLSVANLGIVNC